MKKENPEKAVATNESSGVVNTNKSLSTPQLSLPKGGGAIRGIEEKFQVSAITGTSSFSIPLPFSASRDGSPPIGLSYNSGSGNSPFGLGWQLGVPSIVRKTEKRLPRYNDEEESDTFMIAGAEDLVPLLEKQGSNWVRHKQLRSVNGTAYTIKRYRPRIEGAFTRIEKWKNNTTGEVHWKTISASNFHSYYGLTPESRKADPADPLRVFEWMLCRGHDDKGNISLLQYKKEDFLQVPANVYEKNRIGNSTQLYLKKIYYGIKTPWYLGDPLPDAGDFMFQTVFDYGEHDSAETITAQIFDDTTNVWPCRKDPFSTYRSGFEIRTYRRCKRILTFHLFDELPINPCLVKSLELFYDDDLEFTGSGKKEPGFSYLVHAKHSGHIWRPATNSYSSKSLPELEIKYEQHAWNTEVTFLKDQNTIHALSGLQDKRYLWIDLFSEGISGILTEQAGTMYYKSNFGEGTFSAPKQVSPKPSFSGLSDGTVLIQELKGDGVKYLVQSLSEPKGFFKLGDEEDWEPMKNFLSIPNININDPNLRTLDLTGDGIADLLVSDGDSFLWYEGLGEDGFSVSKKIYKEIDEEKGPSIVFADREQSIFLVDMNGDGLTDIARIRNGEICFWPNLGFGKFGRKVAMANPPLFDHPDTFNPIYLRLADIDGSGTTDIIYLGKNDFRAWMNQNGNEWSTEPHIIAEFPAIHNLSDFAVFDFLGSGTACIVCSGAPDNQPAWYIDLMSGRKPHLFTGYQNNCGKEVSIEYKSSTHFYLEDKKAGRKWATKLPFPVHCIYKTKSEDKIRKTIFTSSYRYSHGYFDHEEREFRGFGRVEQLDSEEFSQFKLNDAKNVAEEIFHQPPVRTVSWFHTGAWLRNTSIIHQYKEEYFQNTQLIEYDLPDAVIPAGLSAEEIREAYRACKGLPLRVEVYANDNLAESIFPFTAAGSTAVIKIVQPRAFNKHAVFLVAAAESISYGYDRNPADPRISHSFILETNEFGMPLKTASIVYKRVTRPTGDQMIPDKVWEEQSKSHVVYDEANYTDDITEDDIYRLRVACESKSYEIGGIDIAAGTFITLKDLNLKIAIATEILFEQDFSAGTQKRLSSHGRNYFLNDHLNAPLALGKLSSLGLTYKSYQLAFTKGLIAKYYNTGTTRVPDSMLLDAKYIHSQGDQHWWTQSGETIFSPDARDKFYTVIGIKDVFGNESFVQYDQYIFLAKKTTDAIGNFSTVINDYRTLSPVLLTDPNLNRTAVETDEIGVTIKSALLGKEGMGEGDSLSDPTTRMEYDLMNWKNNGMPNYTHSFSREQHGNGNPRWQESYSYWDGGGAVIMVKNQVNGGTAKRWNATSKAIEEINTDSRWLGNGRTLYNNKGNPVKKYEPYFSTTHEYESEDALVETGMSPFMFYDAIGRNIRTEFPNGTFTKVEFDQWHSKSFDPIDTVKDSQWFIDRGSPNPTATEPLDPEHRAAWLALKHYNTPSVSYLDSAGKGVYSVADYGNGKKTNVYSQSDLTGRYSKLFDQLGRKVSESYVSLSGIPMYSKTAEKGERWILTDVLGRVVKVWDNVRELYATFDKLHRPVSTYIKEGARETLFSHLVYGDLFPDDIARLKNIKGRVYQLYDQGGVATITAIDFKGNPTAVERRLTKSYKQTIDWSPLKGINDINTIESLASVQLETEVFSSSTRLDALNRPMLVTLPDNSIVQPGYNERNLLHSLEVKIRGKGDFITFLNSQDYDAKGQRQFAKYGNGTITKYFYDPKTFLLTNLVTKLNETDSDNQCIQNLKYTFDPAGNIVQQRDDAQFTHFFKNAVVYPESKYEYDAVYQLKKATGREHAGLGGNAERNELDLPFLQQLPHQNNTDAVRVYREEYEYDDCGNVKYLQHKAANANWTTRYKYEYDDDPFNLTNRLKATSLQGDAEGTFSAIYQHDRNGNMTSMPHLSAADSLKWNFMDQLKEVNLGGGGTAYYVYGADGNRIRKIIERQGGKKNERIYLGFVEIYRESQNNGDTDLERYTLNIADNTGRIAQVDSKTIDKNNSDPFNNRDENNIRYQYTNHLGSATLETDNNGNIISYEEYHPYGTSAYRISRPGSDLGLKRYRFSGKEKDDETGFYYFGARYFAAWLIRWTSSDPAGFTDGLNLFCYCNNNPVSFHDPTGTDSKPADGGVRHMKESEIGSTMSVKPDEGAKNLQTDPSPESGKKFEQWARSLTIEFNGDEGDIRHYVGGELVWVESEKGKSFWFLYGGEWEAVEYPEYSTTVVGTRPSGGKTAGDDAKKDKAPERDIKDEVADKAAVAGSNIRGSSQGRQEYVKRLNEMKPGAEELAGRTPPPTMDEANKYVKDREQVRDDIRNQSNRAQKGAAELFEEGFGSNPKIKEAGFDPHTAEGRAGYYEQTRGLTPEDAVRAVVRGAVKSNPYATFMSKPGVKIGGTLLLVAAVVYGIYDTINAPSGHHWEVGLGHVGGIVGAFVAAEVTGVIVGLAVAAGLAGGWVIVLGVGLLIGLGWLFGKIGSGIGRAIGSAIDWIGGKLSSLFD